MDDRWLDGERERESEEETWHVMEGEAWQVELERRMDVMRTIQGGVVLGKRENNRGAKHCYHHIVVS